MKFNIGDRVQTKLTRTPGTVRRISNGLVAVETDDPNVGVPIPIFEIPHGLFLSADAWEKISPSKIVITSDGKTTLARLYDCKRVIRRAEAKCSPEDTYDFATGANLAYDRLMRPETLTASVKPYAEPARPTAPAKEPKPEPKPVKLYCVKTHQGCLTKGKTYTIDSNGKMYWDFTPQGEGRYPSFADLERIQSQIKGFLVPLVSRPAKAGEWVLITKPGHVPTDANGIADYKKGDILKIIGVENSNQWARYADGDVNRSARVLNASEYEVLDGYDGRYEEPEKPKYYSGKVVCVETHDDFTVGKVYTFAQGKVIDDSWSRRPMSNYSAESLEAWNRDHGNAIARFIEYKGEA